MKELKEVQRLGADSAQLVGYQDEVQRILRDIQGKMIDPLRSQWEASFYPEADPYQSVYYVVGRVRRWW